LLDPHCEYTARIMATERFPIDLGALKPLAINPQATALTEDEKKTLLHNIQLCRDAIVFFTALAGAKGLSGHTGGAYDTVPEVMIIRALIAGGAPIVPPGRDSVPVVRAGWPHASRTAVTLSRIQSRPARPS
jgi:hypothetical protein